MKIYQVVNTRRPGLEHDGFEYFFNKKEAEKKQKQNNKDYLELMEEDDYENLPFEPDEVSVYEFEMNKKGIIGLLIQIASHPDNG